MIPTKVEYQIRYEDDSGPEYRVSYDSTSDGSGRVEIESCAGDVWIDPDKIDWLIDCLYSIKSIIQKGEDE